MKHPWLPALVLLTLIIPLALTPRHDSTQLHSNRNSSVLDSRGEKQPSETGEASVVLDLEISEDNLPLLTAIHRGSPIRISLGNTLGKSYLFRPRSALAEDFQLSLGADRSNRIEEGVRIFEGIPQLGNAPEATASLVVVGDSLAAVVRGADGDVTYIRTHPETQELQARVARRGNHAYSCGQDVGNPHWFQMSGDDEPLTDEQLWQDAVSAQIEPDVAALTGIDPSNNQLDKYINPIARATRYDASLKDAMLMLVLDKQATGANTTVNLTSKASLFLATVSNVAASYENQLGIRLLVQELIMIPNDDDFTDIATGSSPLDNFRNWMAANRRQNLYRWTVATKFGAGLEGNTLGVAFTQSAGSSLAVNVCRSTAEWDVLAHEIGHNLGSNHSSGGIMNSSSLNGSSRSFFTDVSAGETAAKDIYDHSASRLIGAAALRHPEQIPFANRDSANTAVNTPIRIAPLDNDLASVRNGQENALALEEVSTVLPLDAGEAEIIGEEILFTPRDGFQGTAWFSYSVRGSVGNGDRGWLHKGDVAIDVGSITEPTRIPVAPGASYSFIPIGGTSGLTQPSQARVDRSRDDSRLLVIRVEASALGAETFRAGGRTYTLDYSARSPRVTNDRFVYDPAEEQFRFNPLLNDEGAGEMWVYPIAPTVGNVSEELFPTTFHLVRVENLTPDKGAISTVNRTFSVAGIRQNALDSTLTFTPSDGATGEAVIEYTVSDAAGMEATGVIEIVLPFRFDTLVASGDIASYRVPSSAADQNDWMQFDYDDRAWETALNGLGYDTSGDYQPSIVTEVTNLQGVNTSLYLRVPFRAARVSQYTQLSLRMKVDDGFVAYLNGTEVARSANAPAGAPLDWDATTTVNAVDAQAQQFATFDISAQLSTLREGDNVLAIHGLNGSPNSSDFLLVPEIVATAAEPNVVIESPTSSAVGVPLGGRLVLRAKLPPLDEPPTMMWRQTAGPDNGIRFEDTVSASTLAAFDLPGTYDVTFEIEAADGQTFATSLSVTVPTSTGLANGVAPYAGGDRTIDRLLGDLSGRALGADSVEWSVIDGPAEARIANPEALDTAITFLGLGNYTVRLTAERDGVAMVDDAILAVGLESLAENGLAAYTLPATGVTASVAVLNARAYDLDTGFDATLFVGSREGGTSSEAWERRIELGRNVSPEIEYTVSDLIFETDYHYRLRLTSGNLEVWSDPSTFTTGAGASLLPVGASARYVSPLDDSVDGVWMQAGFDDSLWMSGPTGIGYDRDPDYDSLITSDVEEMMFEQTTSLYIRIPFTVTAPELIDTLTLLMRYDDAFVAYLNGQEVTRSATAPGLTETLSWNTPPSALQDDADAVVAESFDLTNHRGLLVRGENILAIHGMNFIIENLDFLIVPELRTSSRHRHYAAWVSGFPGLPVSLAGVQEDPDDDGLTNFQEFALGGNPSFPDHRLDTLVPMISLADGEWTFRYQRSSEARNRGIQFKLEYSDDLQRWFPLENFVERVQPVQAEVGFESVSLPLSSFEGTQRFWRLVYGFEDS